MKTGLRQLLSIGGLTLLIILAFALPSSSLSHPALQEPGTTEVEETLLRSTVGNGLPDSRSSDPLPSAWPPDAQSTTGPVPPPGIEPGIQGLEELAATVVLDVPIYMWHHGCGPTAAGMVFGYWDGNGFDNLVPGNADTQTAAVDAMIASTGNYNDYCLPLDYWPDPILDDLSELPVGDEHPDNCVADLMKTSQSYYSNYYGWSWFSDVDDSMQGYVDMVAPEYSATTQNQTWGVFNWDTYRAEIDAGRPVVLLVDVDGNGATDHFVTAIGYNDSGTMYGCHDTWDPPGVDWHTFAPMGSGQPWGIFGATLFQIETPQCSDPHEPNDTAGQATPISYGTTLTDPDICPEADLDYYSFLASAGDTIIADIDAQNIGSSLDSHLYLYDTDGVTVLTENDDYGALDSRIEYTLPADGTYYLKVQEYDHPNEGGPGYFYTTSLWRWTHRIFLPLVMKNYGAAAGWVTIVSEDFEGAFPGPWIVDDNEPGYGEYCWGKRNCRPYQGGYSGWGVGGCADGASLACDNDYPNYTESWMVYGPFSLVGATAADLQFRLWLNTELNYDGVCRHGSTNGTTFYGTCTSGDSGGWVDKVLDLSNVPTLGNLLGQPQVWVALVFDSDSTINYSEGGYVDNVVLRKYMSASGAVPPAIGLESVPDGAEITDIPRMMVREE
jgi:hypothetical protein